MIAAGRIKADQVKVVWQSEPLPNDALAVRKDLDPQLRQSVTDAVLAITPEKAKMVMPTNYTGWERATPHTYDLIEAAGRGLGRIGS